MTKILAITQSNLLDIFRDFRSNAIVFVLPVVFIFIFGFLFSQVSSIETFKLGILTDVSNQEYNDFIKQIELLDNSDNNSLFVIQKFDTREKLQESLRNKQNEIGLIPGNDKPFLLITDQTNQRSQVAKTILTEITIDPNLLPFEFSNIIDTNEVSGFELQAAGLIVYGILIMIPQVAGMLAKLNNNNLIFRYALSNVKSYEILGGFTLSSLFIGIIQSILLFYVATWFGLKLNIYTLYAFVFIIPVILFAIGLGLLIGSFASNGESAQNTGTISSIILGFLSGSFIVGIERIGMSIGSIFISITDFVPTYYASSGITQLIIYNNKLDSVLFELIIISISSLLIFILGAIIFNNKKMQKY
jgi:ABC-type multidrug transport system permease subunit